MTQSAANVIFDEPPSNHDRGPWKEISCADGVRLIEVSNFDVFCQFVNAGFGDSDCRQVWRGQKRAKWEITSSLGRTGKQEMDHLRNFRDAVSRCSNTEYDISQTNVEGDKLRLWALGQHHGLATPLTDWTVYPYVALFFAFVEPEDGKGDDFNGFRALFALNWDEVSSVNFTIVETEGMKPFRAKLENPPYTDEFKKYIFDNFGFRGEGAKLVEESRIPPQSRKKVCELQHAKLKRHQLGIYRPESNENARMNSQGGWHIYTPEGMSVDAWIRSNHASSQVPLLARIHIPNAERTTILRCLNKMNINYLSLFPDLDGAARYCNMALHERRWALGLREY